MVFNLLELIHMTVTVLGVGYIFMDYFKQRADFDPLHMAYKRFDFTSFKYAIITVAPAVLLHEFAHKFSAMAYGLSTQYVVPDLFGIPFGGILIGVVLKAASTPFLVFIPGAIAMWGTAHPLVFALTAALGPLTNLALYFASKQLVDYQPKYRQFFLFSMKINLLLFWFNLIPIPGFDGYHVVSNIIAAIQIIYS